MAKYLSQKELIKEIELNISQIESGQLSPAAIEEHLNLVRELYERTLILRYKAFEHITTTTVSPVEIAAPIEQVEEQKSIEVEESSVSENTAENISFTTEEIEATPEIEFDFFSESTAEETIEEPFVNQSEISLEEPMNKFEEETSIQEDEFQSNDNLESFQITDFSTNDELQKSAEKIENELPSQVAEDLLQEEQITENKQLESETNSLIVNKVAEVQAAIKSQLGFQPLSTLIGAFGLNERLLYINELFDGSSESFSDAIKQLDTMSDLAHATTFTSELASKFNWEIDSDTVEEFIHKLCRRFI